ncbi:MAG: metallophosphoesterase [Anaerolineaceae bacterium]|nr:metallophosphoesterase [Anaerolineaceae bacterium]
MKLLTISDIELGFIYSPRLVERFQDVDLVISCGDLPYYYLEYIVSSLNVPLYYVRGNHANQTEYSSVEDKRYPWGAIDVHRRNIHDDTGVLITGIEGSINYNDGPCQYSQSQMWSMIYRLVPGLMINKLRFGRYLDIFVTHAPPWKIHDMDDRPHQGIKAFRWFLSVFKPIYHFHGHIHIYRNDTIAVTRYLDTQVINTYGYREIIAPLPPVIDKKKSLSQKMKGDGANVPS